MIDDVSLAEGLSYVWSYDNRYGMKASAYVSNTDYAAESWLISPKFKLDADATLSYNQALNYFSSVESFATEATVWIKEEGGSWEQLTGITYPTSNSWNFANSGEISLAEYTGKVVQIGFKYLSTTKAGTWEIQDIAITK